MNTRGTGPQKGLMTEINMVPFIDIVLVLLIIFMIVSPFIDKNQIPLNVPEAGAEKTLTDEKSVVIQITKEGEFFVQDDKVTPEELSTVLRQTVTNEKPGSVLVRADKDVAFDAVAKALDAARSLGNVRVGVAVRGASS